MGPVSADDIEWAAVVTQPGTPMRAVFSCRGSVVAGRDAACEIHLPHPLVSRRHARIAFDPEQGFLIEDLGSRNGTLSGGVRLETPAHLTQPASIEIGPFVVAFDLNLSGETWTATGPQLHVPRSMLDAGKRQFHVDGDVALEGLSAHEFAFLEALYRGAPNIVSRTAAGDAVWGSGQWDVYMLHNLVSRLRRRLGQQGADESVIVTVPGAGYRLE